MTSMCSFIRPKRFVAALLLGTSATAFALDPQLEQGRRLIEAGDGRAAYALLEPLETQRAGDPEYDLLLGRAAIDAGERTRAVFALERVLALQPGNAQARAELARAYLLLGENRAAREEFERVRQQDIPRGVADTIDRLLAMIERAERRNRPSLKGFVELSAGSDSNVNSSTDNPTVAVPALGIATLNPNSVKNGDSFATLAGGLSYRHPLGGGNFLTAGVNATERQNRNDSQFDTRAIDGALGWQRTRGAETVNVALTASSFARDGTDLRDTVGITAQLQQDLDAVRQVSLFLQYLAMEYPGQTIRDVDRYVAGVGYAQALAHRTVAFGSLYGGEEAEKAANVPHLGHALGGIRAGVLHRFDERWSVLANLAYEARRYGGNEPLFFEKRKDDQIEAGVSLSYQPSEAWKLAARAAYVEVDSTIPVYRYDREVFTLSGRFQF
jgi:tetratricopeptide (TPR) repeat protein